MTPVSGQLAAALSGQNPILVTPFSLSHGTEPIYLLTLTPKVLLLS